MLFVSMPFSAAATEEDDYLSAISDEAEKVEQNISVDTNGTGQTLREFDAELKSRYRGTYTFYRKLPRRSREEIYQDYRDGASIDEIRKKIMDRFLNR